MEEVKGILKSYASQRPIVRNQSKSACPKDEEMAAFAEGCYKGRKLRQMMDHLSQCSHCLHEVVELKKMMAEVKESEFVEIPDYILETSQVVLDTLSTQKEPLLVRVKENFKVAARSLSEEFISIYHSAEQESFEVFWNLLSPMIEKGVELQRSEVEVGALGIVGRDSGGERVTPSVILTVLSVFNTLQILEEIDKDFLKKVIREKAKIFDLPRKEKKELENYIIRELGR